MRDRDTPRDTLRDTLRDTPRDTLRDTQELAEAQGVRARAPVQQRAALEWFAELGGDDGERSDDALAPVWGREGGMAHLGGGRHH